jgi:hypothetical protein
VAWNQIHTTVTRHVLNDLSAIAEMIGARHQTLGAVSSDRVGRRRGLKCAGSISMGAS